MFLMRLFRKIHTASRYFRSLNQEKKKVGFVPTMGALHNGHLSLIARSKEENDITVCSIFINPAQFNNLQDLQKYPRTTTNDIQKLNAIGCDALFIPSVEEMYPDHKFILTNDAKLGYLENIMEGIHRPGHFRGVVLILGKLFDIVRPNKAYFGEKDYQQLAVVKRMVETKKLPIKIIGCPTVREADGLAMSSRNIRLSPEQRVISKIIPKILFEATRKREKLSISELKKWVVKNVESTGTIAVEYFEIVDETSLLPIKRWDQTSSPRGCIAVKIGNIRLIDNIALI